MITYVLPTRDRPEELGRTLKAIGTLARHQARVVVVDNASSDAVVVPDMLGNGIACEFVRLDRNRSTAARNVGVQRAIEAAGRMDDHWIVMLDDDSAPMDSGFVDVLAAMPDDVGAVAAEVLLPTIDGRIRHEAGGLPEVFTGCGAAIRAGVFVQLDGYDESFDYYAEEYDFCAKVILAGLRVVYSRQFRVMHRKVASQRDLGRIIGNLARNNAWVMARYAPSSVRAMRVEAQLLRYASIAEKEGVADAVTPIIARALETVDQQPRREMSIEQWERFIGVAACERHLSALAKQRGWKRVEIVAPGKGEGDIASVITRLGLSLNRGEPDARIVGSLSPGVIIDATRDFSDRGAHAIAPWDVGPEWIDPGT